MPKNKFQRGIDWESLRVQYLNSDIDLYELSWEHSENDAHPVWDTLRKRASKEKWKVARAEKNAKALLKARGTGTLDIEVTGELEQARRKLIDAELTIHRHVEVADSFLKLYKGLMPRVEKAFANVDIDVLEADPIALSTFTKNMQSIAKEAIEIERRVLGLSDIKIDILKKIDAKVEVTETNTTDLTSLSDQELSQLYFESLKEAEVVET